jgi:alpha-1,2-mannosyltransferase
MAGLFPCIRPKGPGSVPTLPGGMLVLRAAFARFWGHPNRDLWLWFGFFLVAVAYYYFHFQKYPGGLRLYRHAAECMWNQQVLQDCESLFTYPPAFAFLMIPFVAAPVWLALLIWYAITIVCTVWCCRLCEDLTVRMFPGRWSDRDREWLRLWGILVALKFILAVYEDQAYDLLVLPFTLSGILALTDRRDVLAGLSLGAAAALKVTPLIFLPYLIFKRRFAAAGIFVAALVVISFLPDLFLHPQGGPHGYFMTWVREIAAPGVFDDASGTRYAFWSGPNPYNLSLRGAVALVLDKTPYEADFLFWLRAVQLTFIAVMSALFIAASRAKMIPIEGALLIMSALLLAPMTGRGHYVGLLLPYYLVVAGVLMDRSNGWFGSAALVISFSLSGIPHEIAPSAFSEFMRMHSDIIYATLILIVYFATVIKSPGRWDILPSAPPRDRALPRVGSETRSG